MRYRWTRLESMRGGTSGAELNFLGARHDDRLLVLGPQRLAPIGRGRPRLARRPLSTREHGVMVRRSTADSARSFDRSRAALRPSHWGTSLICEPWLSRATHGHVRSGADLSAPRPTSRTRIRRRFLTAGPAALRPLRWAGLHASRRDGPGPTWRSGQPHPVRRCASEKFDVLYLQRRVAAGVRELEQRLRPLSARVVGRGHGRGAHQLGTCAMGDDGVVNEKLRHHDVEKNPYVAGGSAFPSSGALHSTLTMPTCGVPLGQHVVRNNVGGP